MKKIFISLLVIATIILGMGATVLAGNMQFRFNVSSGGSSDYTYATQKNDATRYWYVRFEKTMTNYPGVTSNWVIGETLRTRVRDDATRQVAYSTLVDFQRSLKCIDYGITYEMDYDLPIAPKAGAYYRLYCDKPQSDKYNPLIVVGRWCA